VVLQCVIEIPKRSLISTSYLRLFLTGIPRPPFDSLLRQLVVPKGKIAEEVGVPPVVSVDIPSGWHVENGDTEGTGFMPDMLVTLLSLLFAFKD
jgi:NAD(P)H-hydrate repair Nnr-like enzyme with NAD(P)H-hydrate epimerase domain